MEKLKISLVAKKLGVSLNSVYRKIKQSETKLNGYIIKENGLTYVSLEGIEILQSLFAKLNHGENTDNTNEMLGQLKEVIASQQKTIDCILRERSEERARADAIIMKLTHQLSDFQKVLEFKNTFVSTITVGPVRKVEPWQPDEVADPLEGKPWYKRAITKLFYPERMRKHSF